MIARDRAWERESERERARGIETENVLNKSKIKNKHKMDRKKSISSTAIHSIICSSGELSLKDDGRQSWWCTG